MTNEERKLIDDIKDIPNYPKVYCPMSTVNRWYLDNKEYAESEPFFFPLEKAKIIFDDDPKLHYNVYTVTEGDESLTAVFVEFFGEVVFGWEFVNPIERRGWCPTKDDLHYLMGNKQSMIAEETINTIMKHDVVRDANKKIWRAMQYANLYREQIVSKEVSTETIKKVWNGKKYKNRSVTLHSKVYTLPELSAIPKHRKWTRPTEEVSVRGFWRHYKNGKKTWVKPFSKYTENEVKSAPTYIL